VTGAALGHKVLVHRALLGVEHALVTHDSAEEGLALGSVVFQHLYTLSRGYTPAVISDLTVSDDGQLVAVSSAKGTTHVFRLPPLHSAALGGHIVDAGAVRFGAGQPTAPGGLGVGLCLGGNSAASRPVNVGACLRIRQGSVLMQEGLMPKCGFLGLAQQSASSRRMYVATRAGTLALYSISPGPSEGNARATSSGATVVASGGSPATFTNGEGSEWQAVLTKEVYTCRPFRHFKEQRLSPQDLGMVPASARRAASPSRTPSRAASPGPASAFDVVSPRASPLLGPRPSPLLGPRTSPLLGSRSPTLGPRPSPDEPAGGGGAAETSKWLSSVETATHVPTEVPLWLCPQLSFHAYPTAIPTADLHTRLRSGRAVPGCRRIAISRLERPGDTVQFDGSSASPGREERLSRLVDGALGTAVNDFRTASPSRVAARLSEGPRDGSLFEAGRPPTGMGAAVAVAPAWGVIADQHRGGLEAGGSLEQVDGIGTGLEEVEEDWLKA